ncbi:MAG: SurA N-terminal domain-containing protein [Pontibacterium sp.]
MLLDDCQDAKSIMLQTIRENSKGIIAKIIVGLIAVTFALFGVESLVSLTGGSNAPAIVNGEEISERQLLQGVELQRRQLLSQMGENADPTLLDDNVITKMVLDGLIEQSVLTQSAQAQGLAFSDRMIDQTLVNTPNFQVDGNFDRAQFESVLRNAGLTPLSYRDLLQKEKVIEQQRTAYILSAFATDADLKRVIALDQQTRDLSYFTLNAADIRAQIKVTDDEAQAYFDSHAADYQTAEQVVVEYVLLDKAPMQAEVEVSEEDLQAQYQVLLANFEGEEERSASHILIEISEARTAEAAEAQANAIAARLAAGESFAELAKAESDDPGSSDNGGDLGFNGKGVFVPEFEDALFALEKTQVSAPVRTEFGFHIIKLNDVKASAAPAFEAVKSDLRRDLAREKVEAIYVDRLERLADISFSSGDLVEPSEALGLALQVTEPFSRMGGEADITSQAKVIASAFSEELLKEGVNSAPLELDASRTVVVRVKEHLLPRPQAFDEVVDQVKVKLADEKVAKKLDADVAAMLEALAAGADLATQAGSHKVSRLEAVTRSQKGLPTEVRAEAFKMAHPVEGAASYAAVTLGDGSRAVVAVTAVKAGSVADLAEKELDAMRAMLGSRNGQYTYGDLVSALKAKAEIEHL